MIRQGSDGLSRGNFSEGVMNGTSMLKFVPLALNAIQRSPSLLQWVRHWTSDVHLTPLTEIDWLTKGQGVSIDNRLNSDGMQFLNEDDSSTLLWCPPPCLANVCIEYLRKSIHKRPHKLHVLIVPKIMTYYWRRQVFRTCDVSFYIDTGHPSWPLEMHESIFVAIYLPLLHCFPWTYRKSNSVLALERRVREMQKTQAGSESSVLREFLLFSRRLSTLHESVVRFLLSEGRIR